MICGQRLAGGGGRLRSRPLRCHNARVPQRRAGLLALAWLLCWLATPVVSLALLVHVAADHHDPHHDQHATLELALAATHGHSHQLDSADHRHHAVREVGPPAVPAPQLAGGPDASQASLRGARAELSDPSPPTGSPPLFQRHCALLL